jgi:hypothetical protein
MSPCNADIQQAGVQHACTYIQDDPDRMQDQVHFRLKQFLFPCRPDRLEQAGAAPIIPARSFPNSATFHTAGRSDPAHMPATSRTWTSVECTWWQRKLLHALQMLALVGRHA